MVGEARLNCTPPFLTDLSLEAFWRRGTSKSCPAAYYIEPGATLAGKAGSGVQSHRTPPFISRSDAEPCRSNKNPVDHHWSIARRGTHMQEITRSLHSRVTRGGTRPATSHVTPLSPHTGQDTHQGACNEPKNAMLGMPFYLCRFNKRRPPSRGNDP